MVVSNQNLKNLNYLLWQMFLLRSLAAPLHLKNRDQCNNCRKILLYSQQTKPFNYGHRKHDGPGIFARGNAYIR